MPLDDLLGDGRRQAPGREVVEEEERRGALHEDVVDAVVDEIVADGVVPVRQERHLQLRADAVGARHQHRFAKSSGRRDETARRTMPMSDSTPGVNVPRARPLMRRTASLPASMSTPEDL